MLVYQSYPLDLVMTNSLRTGSHAMAHRNRWFMMVYRSDILMVIFPSVFCMSTRVSSEMGEPTESADS